MRIFVKLLLLVTFALSSCVVIKENTYLDPSWINSNVKNIAILGFVPYSIPSELSRLSLEQNETDLSVWWHEQINHQLSTQIMIDNYQYNWIPYDEVVATLQNQREITRFESFKKSVEKHSHLSVNGTNSTFLVDPQQFSNSQVQELCNILGVDALLFGIVKSKARTTKTSRNGQILPQLSYWVSLYSSLSLVNKHGEELWHSTRVFDTAIGDKITLQLTHKIAADQFVKYNTPNLFEEAIEYYSSILPIPGETSERIYLTQLLPLIIPTAEELTIWFPYDGLSGIQNDQGDIMVHYSKLAKKITWDYKWDGMALPTTTYTLKVHYPLYKETFSYRMEP